LREESKRRKRKDKRKKERGENPPPPPLLAPCAMEDKGGGKRPGKRGRGGSPLLSLQPLAYAGRRKKGNKRERGKASPCLPFFRGRQGSREGRGGEEFYTKGRAAKHSAAYLFLHGGSHDKERKRTKKKEGISARSTTNPPRSVLGPREKGGKKGAKKEKGKTMQGGVRTLLCYAVTRASVGGRRRGERAPGGGKGGREVAIRLFPVRPY